MAHRAYNRMRLADGTVVEGPLVVVGDEGCGPIRWHRLAGEEAFTEWVGGTYMPSSGAAVRETNDNNNVIYIH